MQEVSTVAVAAEDGANSPVMATSGEEHAYRLLWLRQFLGIRAPKIHSSEHT